MSDSADARERPIEAEYREYVRGNLPNQDAEPDAYDWAGLVHDPELREVLAYCEEAYEPLTADAPREFGGHRVMQELRKKHGTHSGTMALEAGNMSQLSYFSGLVGYKRDVSGMQALMQLQRLIEETPVFISYLYGVMGSGKTDFAMLLLEVFASVYGRENVHMAANVRSDDLDEHINHYSELVERLEDRRDRIQDGEELDPFIFVVDEAAQIFTGSGSDQHKAKQLAKLLKLARKSNAHILLIGQDGKDIGPSLRALCTVFVQKVKHSEKTYKANLYQDVKNREGQGEIMSLDNVPETNYDDFSTWDEGDFVFDDEDDAEDEDLPSMDDIRELEEDHEREMMAILSTTSDLTNAEVGEIYEVSERTVRRAKAEYEDELEELDLI